MNLSYQEKSIGGSVAALVVVYGTYFVDAVLGRGGGVGRLVKTVVLLVAIEVVYHIVIAILDRPEAQDERDRMIGAVAHRNGYVALAGGVALLMCYAVLSPALTPFVLAQAMLAALVAAEVVKGVTQLYLYRAGV